MAPNVKRGLHGARRGEVGGTEEDPVGHVGAGWEGMGFGWGPTPACAPPASMAGTGPRTDWGRSDPRGPELAYPPCTVRARTTSRAARENGNAEAAEARGDALRWVRPGNCGGKGGLSVCCGHGGARRCCPACRPVGVGVPALRAPCSSSELPAAQSRAEAGRSLLPSLSGPLCL